MEVKEVLISGLTFFASLTLVITFVAFGWYLVWKLFLSRFRFIRELLGNHQEANVSMEEQKQARLRSTRKVRRD